MMPSAADAGGAVLCHPSDSWRVQPFAVADASNRPRMYQKKMQQQQDVHVGKEVHLIHFAYREHHSEVAEGMFRWGLGHAGEDRGG